MTHDNATKRYLYWLDEEDFDWATAFLLDEGFTLHRTLLTPCQVMKAHDNKLIYAPPAIWSGICKRQGSWYRDSKRAGQYMIMSEHRLPGDMDAFLDAQLGISDFIPENLPTQAELEEVIQTSAYQSGKPDEWERIGWRDSVMFKIFFSLTRFWGWGDNLPKHWLGHRANHANFVSRKFTTELDGEQVAYSLTENAGVCSSCAEFFNVVDPDSRKLVRACPGSVTFGAAQRDVYYDVKPVLDTSSAPRAS